MLGGIARAAFGETPRESEFDLEALIGRRFRHMTSHNERGGQSWCLEPQHRVLTSLASSRETLRAPLTRRPSLPH